MSTVQSFESRNETTYFIEKRHSRLVIYFEMKDIEYHGGLTVTSKNPHVGNEILALSDVVIGFSVKVVIQFCLKVSFTL